MSSIRARSRKSRRSPRGFTTAPESRWAPGARPFSTTATGTSPRRSATSGCSSSSCPSRIAHARPAGPAPTTSTPTSIRSSIGSVGSVMNSCGANGGGYSAARVIPAPAPAKPPPPLLGGLRRAYAHSLRRLALLHELGQLGDDLVHVTDDAEIAELEDRRVRIFVDRDDHVRALHAHLVLDRARDAERHVELRRHDLPRLPDLRGVRVPARVDDGARRTDRTPERTRELLGEREVLRSAEAATPRDDHICVLDRGAARLLLLLADDLRAERVVLVLDRDVLDLRLAARAFPGVERAGAEEREPRLRLPADVDENGVLESRSLSDERAVTRVDVDEIPVEAGIEPRRKACRDVGGEHRVREEHGVVAAVAHDLRQHVDARLRQRRLERVVFSDVHLSGPEPSRLPCER